MNYRLLTATVFILSIVLVSSCKKDDDIQTKIDDVNSFVESGNWRISYFVDSGNNETTNFSAYSFSFNDGGAVIATNGSTTYNGTWSVTDSSSDDDSQDDLDFNINFPVTNDFEDLNDDWDIKSYSSTKIELVDVSGGDGSTDYLTFTKN